MVNTPHPFDLAGPLPSGTVVLEASAGTGKTYTIAALAARYIAEGVATLPQLMIVTFSRAATQELRSRVRERLEQTRAALAADEPPEDDAVSAALWDCPAEERAHRTARLGDALASFDAATIATTHEFCHRMVAGLGTLAAPEPDGEFVEDLGPEIRAAVLDRYIARFGDLPAHDRPFPIEDAEHWVQQIFLQPGIEIGPDGGSGVDATRVEFCREVRDLVDERRQRRGISTYDDMLTRLAAALRHEGSGELAARRLAARFPVVLVDEFQDTDPLQWEILQRAFVGRSTVVLIGDPKQAIYAFRGADVYSYLGAVRSQADVATLGTNFRSDEQLLQGIDALLGGAALGEPEIVVRPVLARHAGRLVAPDTFAAPVRIRTLTPDDDDPSSWPPIADVRTRIRLDLVRDIRDLLDSGARLQLDDDERPVAPADIAVLVSKNRTGEEIQRALLEAGIPAVCSGVRSVYATDAAQDWLRLLVALESQRPADIRAAALTSFVGWSLADLTSDDDSPLTALSTRLRGWARVLAERGGMAALIEEIWTRSDLAERVLRHTGGERLLTDLRHIGQNLQAAQSRDGMRLTRLIVWLQERMDETAGDPDERGRRLETDAAAVQIMTVHRSKGLEFPIVYLPEAGDRWANSGDEGGVFVVHSDPNGTGELTRMIDVGGVPRNRQDREGRTARYNRHRQEEAGDDLRKFYVALTRAQCQVTCWWAPTKHNSASSALQRALFRAAEGIPEPSYALIDLARVQARLEAAGITFQDVPPPLVVRAPDRTVGGGPDLRAARFTRRIDHAWRRTSYSALTAEAHAAVPLDRSGREPDEPELDEFTLPGPEDALVQATGIAARLSPMSELAGGTQFGSLIHAILEYVDPTSAALSDVLAAEASRWLARYPLPGVDVATLSAALEPALRTPLGPLAGGRTLADVAVADRLAELDFELPLGSREHHATLAGLADVIEAYQEPGDPLAAYPELLRSEGLGEQQLKGFLTGSIDALLRLHDADGERYVIVDYKTNRVGPPGAPLLVGNYSRTAMAEAMMQSHYPLQALLYAVATHRFLRWRLPHYDPERHLGGVLYLFVRGMAGPESITPEGSYGVFDWHPQAAMIVALSDLIGGLR